MCHGDTSLATFTWQSFTSLPLVNDTAPHQCVNFEKLYKWGSENYIPQLFDKDYLIHPTLGPAYPNGVGSKLGISTKIPDTDEDKAKTKEEHHHKDKGMGMGMDMGMSMGM
jgi:hypothetical protein